MFLGTGHKVQEGVGWKKSGGGPSFLCTKKGWVKKHHAMHWGWAMKNYASVLLAADMYTYTI